MASRARQLGRAILLNNVPLALFTTPAGSVDLLYHVSIVRSVGAGPLTCFVRIAGLDFIAVALPPAPSQVQTPIRMAITAGQTVQAFLSTAVGDNALIHISGARLDV